MPKHDHMKFKLSLVEARGEADLLRIQMHQHGCTCVKACLPGLSDRLCKLLANIQYKENMEKKERKKARQTPL